MQLDITFNQFWTLIGAAVFGGMIIGALIVGMTKTGHSKHAFWEEE